MTPTEWGVAAIVGADLLTIAAHEVWAWLKIRQYRRKERQLLALYQQRAAAGPGLPGDGAGHAHRPRPSRPARGGDGLHGRRSRARVPGAGRQEAGAVSDSSRIGVCKRLWLFNPDTGRTLGDGNWFTWKLWGLLCRNPCVCPANAHAALIWRTGNWWHVGIDRTCQDDVADSRSGTCWCGKLRRNDAEAVSRDA